MSKGFQPFLTRRIVDVIMPDVKHAGGLLETKKIAARCADEQSAGCAAQSVGARGIGGVGACVCNTKQLLHPGVRPGVKLTGGLIC